MNKFVCATIKYKPHLNLFLSLCKADSYHPVWLRFFTGLSDYRWQELARQSFSCKTLNMRSSTAVWSVGSSPECYSMKISENGWVIDTGGGKKAGGKGLCENIKWRYIPYSISLQTQYWIFSYCIWYFH